MADLIQLRRDTKVNWDAVSGSVILADGEVGIISDQSPLQCKVGDGVSYWNQLETQAWVGTGSLDNLSGSVASLSSSLEEGLSSLEANVSYVVCQTSGSVATKDISVPDFELSTHCRLVVKMEHTHTSSTAPTLRINLQNGTEKALYYDGVAASSTNTWDDNEVLDVYYDGQYYQCVASGGGKFKSGQKVKDVAIKNENGKEVTGTTDVLSAEAGQELNEKVVFSVSAQKEINSNVILNSSGNFVSYTGGQLDVLQVFAGDFISIKGTTTIANNCRIGFSQIKPAIGGSATIIYEQYGSIDKTFEIQFDGYLSFSHTRNTYADSEFLKETPIKQTLITTNSYKFVYGGLNNANGKPVYGTTRMRTNLLVVDENSHVKVNLGASLIKAFFIKYLDGEFVGEFSPSDATDFIVYKDNTFNQIALAFKYSDNSDISQNVIENSSVEISSIQNGERYFNGKYYVALGDSITWGYTPHGIQGEGTQLNSYAKLTAKKLNMMFTNYGISGNQVASPGGDGTPMSVRFTQMDDTADLVTFMGGTNDIRNGVPLGTFDDRENTTYYGALHVLCEGLYRKYILNNKSCKVIALTPPKMLSLPANTANGVGVLYPNQELWVNAFIDVARYYGFAILDFYHGCVITPQIATDFQNTAYGHTGYYNPLIPDGIHPSQDGAEVMANCLIGFLKTVII